MRRATVGHHHDLVIERHRVAAGRFDADMRARAGKDNVLDAGAAQQPLERRRTGRQGAVAVLDDVPVLGLDVERVPKFRAVAARLQQLLDLLDFLGVADDVFKPVIPVRCPAVLVELESDPDHPAPGLSHAGGEFVEGWNDLLRHRPFDLRSGGSIGLTEKILHVDDDHRGLVRRERIEHVDAAAPVQYAVDDVLLDLHVVHGGAPLARVARPLR